MNQQNTLRRLERLKAAARSGQPRYSNAEWAVMEARLTVGERSARELNVEP